MTLNVWLGVMPSEPLNPTLLSIVPNSNLVLGWDVPISDGCLPILSYTVAKDGSDHIMNISPSLVSVTDDLSASGSIGETITYKIKATNLAGDSVYSEILQVIVGTVPNAPLSLSIVQFFTS